MPEALIVGLYFVTELAGFFTLAAKDVYAATGDPIVNIPAGFEGGALDFASSLFCWGIFHLTYSLKIICLLYTSCILRQSVLSRVMGEKAMLLCMCREHNS